MLHSKLLINLSQEDKSKLKQYHTQLKFVFDRISVVLKEDVRKLEDEYTFPPKDVDNWALQQAYLRGQQAAYKKLLDLIEVKE